MHQVSRSAAANAYTMVFAWMSTALLLLSPSTSAAQTTQGGGSLADMARQLRAQKEGGQTHSDGNRAQQIADELSEDSSDNGAPGGFKTFNAGNYRLWVPAPYRVESHDDAGIVLSGPMSGGRRPMVLVGNPIAIHGQNDDAFQDTATHFSHLYARTVTCRKATVASHSAYKCGLAKGDLLGTEVGGNAMFVLSSETVYPVFCVTPTASNNRDAVNDPHLSDGARQSLQQEDGEVRKIWQQCDTVLESFYLVRESTAQQSEQAVKAVKPATPSQAAPAEIAKPALNAAEQSARAAQAVSDSGQQTGNAPPGFKVHPFQYCKGPQQCWNASVLVPADAQLINSTCKQYVFETKIKGNSFLLLVGPEAGDCNGHGGGGPDPVRWNELVDPETKRAPGTYNLISSQGTTLDGKPAVITTIGFRKSLDSWMGKRAEVENNGVPLVVGCLAPRDHFSDGDQVCSALIDSLQMP